MMKKVKENFNLLKYGYHFELNIIGAVICIIVWPLQLFIHNMPFFLVSCIFIINVASTLEMSGIIKTSPKFRPFYFSIQRMVNIAGFLLYFIILFIIKFIQMGSWKKFKLATGNEFVLAGFFYIIIICYMSIAFKFFFIPTAIFFISYLACCLIQSVIDNIVSFTMEQGILIGLVCVAAGMLLSEFLKRITYRKPLSKYALGSSIRKYYF